MHTVCGTVSISTWESWNSMTPSNKITGRDRARLGNQVQSGQTGTDTPGDLSAICRIICRLFHTAPRCLHHGGESAGKVKTSEAVGICKSGPGHRPKNYKPVNPTCLLHRSMEWFIRNQICKHQAKVHFRVKCGFMAVNSCLTNLSLFMEGAVKRPEDNHMVEAQYMNFNKGLDLVNND